MKILLLADFRYDYPRFMLNNSRIFSKGFLRNGHDVMEFSYRNFMLQLSPVKSKKWSLKLAKKKTDRLLASLARHYQPDLVLITAFKLLDADTVAGLKEAVGDATIMCWYGDPPHGISRGVPAIARYCDWFLATSGGQLLQEYKQLGVPHCAFLPNPCDRDFEFARKTEPRWHSKMLFAGKLKHGLEGQDPIRWELITSLVEKKGMTVWGCLGKPTVEGDDYLNAICGSQMALSINVFNDVRFYHSDRLVHLLGCGRFVLAKRVPDSDLLFEDNKHLCYFETIDECFALVERFGADKAAREKIARAGMERVHEAFNCEKLAAYIVDLATKGESKEPWAEIV